MPIQTVTRQSQVQSSRRSLPAPRLFAAPLALILGLAVFGCEGDVGPAGPAGSPGETGPAGPPATLDPALSALEKAYAGVGGKEALADLQSVSYRASGFRLIAGEGFSAFDQALETTSFRTEISVDVAEDAWRIDYQNTIEFFWTGTALNFSEIIRGQDGAIIGADLVFGEADPNQPLNSARVAAVRRQALLLNPVLLLQQAAGDEGQISETGAALHEGRVHHVLELAGDVAPIELLVDAATGTISKVQTLGSDFAVGDVRIEVSFADWRTVPDSGASSAAGLQWPEIAILTIDGDPYHVESRTDIAANPSFAADQFAFPTTTAPAPAFDQELADRGNAYHHNIVAFSQWGLPLLEFKQDAVVLATEIGGADSGVYHLIGGASGSDIPTGSHHTMVVDQGPSVVVIEPALYDEWGQAVVTWIGEQLRDDDGNPKPISHVVLTHHHHDHMGSVRRFAVEGADVVVGADSERFIKDVLRARFSVTPDTLSQVAGGAEVDIVPVKGEPFVIDAGAGTNTVVAIPVETNHAADLLTVRTALPGGAAAYFNSDMYNPAPPVDADGEPVPVPVDRVPASTDLRDALQNRVDGFGAQDGDIMLGGHGLATYDDPRVAGEDASFVSFGDFVGQLEVSDTDAPYRRAHQHTHHIDW